MTTFDELVQALQAISNVADREIQRRRANKATAFRVNHDHVGTTDVWQMTGNDLAAQAEGITLDLSGIKPKQAPKATTTSKAPAKQVRREKASNGVVRTNAEWGKAFDRAFRDAGEAGVGRKRAGKRAWYLCRFEGLAPTKAAAQAIAELKAA